jgi:hypothetical protein
MSPIPAMSLFFTTSSHGRRQDEKETLQDEKETLGGRPYQTGRAGSTPGSTLAAGWLLCIRHRHRAAVAGGNTVQGWSLPGASSKGRPPLPLPAGPPFCSPQCRTRSVPCLSCSPPARPRQEEGRRGGQQWGPHPPCLPSPPPEPSQPAFSSAVLTFFTVFHFPYCGKVHCERRAGGSTGHPQPRGGPSIGPMATPLGAPEVGPTGWNDLFSVTS